ncbi:MAG TPA: CARDB domain-containing protein [Candidatus Polarisedimenticolia bacterium]|nr:CARDB domain-containing protein [Candidatus Polarisedimenticolia bacterium]
MSRNHRSFALILMLVLATAAAAEAQERDRPAGAPAPRDGKRPDLIPELALPGGGTLVPLQLLIMNQSNYAAPASRARLTQQLTCQSADGTSTKTFPVGIGDKVFSVPAIAPNQFYNMPGLSGSNQVCKAPSADYPVCDKYCEVRAVADVDGVVNESNEGNNVATAQVERQ